MERFGFLVIFGLLYLGLLDRLLLPVENLILRMLLPLQ
jgi:hypothetical protein